ncbi:MAG: PKD domain-containing protein [Candidatus Saccharibacteria bacterium]|nr:PKD domain-containing protein [Candidatus Saccharibacteria bacterium]
MKNPQIQKTINSLNNLAKYAPHRLYALVLIAVGVIGLGIATFAYGPDRTTFTAANPATYVTFNSITDAPGFGDERNFTWARPVNGSVNSWQTDELNVQDGQEYFVRVRVHNNAAANLDLHATNTRVSASIPTTLGNSANVQATVSANNANPQQVWDGVVLKGAERFSIGYVPGSARYYNSQNANAGFPIDDSVFTTSGAQVGYKAMDGDLPGCNEFAGALMFKVKVYNEKTPQFNVEKKVRKHGDATWQKSITANPGDKVDYQISYANIGETQQNGVVAKDTLPSGVTYQAGSTTLKNATYPTGDGKAIVDGVASNGVNIGNYTPQSNAFVRFTTTLPQEKDLSCGNNVLHNTGFMYTDNGMKQDSADVTVNRECKDKVSYSCDLLQANKIGPLEYSYNVNLTGNKATAREVTIDFGDGQSAVRSVSNLPVNHTYAAAGQYTVTAKASFDVDGKTVKDVTSDACKVVINTETTTTTGTTTAGTPDSIASTGPAEVIGSVLGIGALGIGIQQWYASRRAVAEAMHHHN